ncbi:MAG: TIGR04255 family protein [Planctomycetes bacterium]|nr:TIGR04255 family protein [Planctomycetota bacterium]
MSELPHFDRPPLIETVLGFQFERLPGLRNAHLGAFWAGLGSDWPHVGDAPPLEAQFETFGPQHAWADARLHLTLTQDPAVRFQIRNAQRDRMVQVQNGRLHYNWLGQAGGDYPRYAAVLPEFERTAGQFNEFVRRRGLGQVRLNQWEVTYVNHIPKGDLWTGPTDWPNVLKTITPPAEVAGRLLESASGDWHYQIVPERGRLHVHLRHGKPAGTGPDMMVLTLTARGPIGEASDQWVNLRNGLDCGHKAIVLAFIDMTTTKAHQYWGLRS